MKKKTRGRNKYYRARSGNFTLRISNHAIQRASERAGVSIDSLLRMARTVADECKLWRDPDRRDDVFDVVVMGLIWRVMVHNKRRGTVLTVMPAEWKERSYATIG
jgi:hypothetical protein